MSARYRIEHDTRYVYASTVATSQHVAYLRPRELPRQHVVSTELTIAPEPTRVIQRTDYFGNAVDQFELLRPHVELRVSGSSVVEVQDREAPVEPAASPAWKDVRHAIESGQILRGIL